MQKMPLDMSQYSKGVSVWHTAILPLPSKSHVEYPRDNRLANIS